MGVKGIDISEHQSTMNVERVARDNNIEFGFVRTNYGANHDDLYFHQHADALERAGAIIVPYVYILASDIRGSIDDAVRIIGSRYKTCIVDWEHDSGGGAELRQAHELLWERGFSTPVVYDPKWYWELVGSPDVSWMQGRVKGHWKSWYADNVPKSYDAALAQVPGYVWQDNRGGIPTVIVQFTGTGRLSSYGSNVDLNYFPGSRQELEALLGHEGDDMSWDTEIPKEPSETDPRTKVRADEMLKWTNVAAWQAADRSAAIEAKLDALLGREAGDVDEAELARQLLAQGLGSQLGRVPDEQFDALVNAVNDESDRRARARASVTVPQTNKGL